MTATPDPTGTSQTPDDLPASLPVAPPPWADRARCARPDVDPELFHPAEGERGHARTRRIQAAMAVCAGCRVRETCLAHALDTNEDRGIWGGTTETDRRQRARTVPHHSQTAHSSAPGTEETHP